MKRKIEENNIYILLLICIIIIREGWRNNDRKIEIIIARYNEKLWWIDLPFFDIFDIIIYNKGKKIIEKDFKREIKVINLRNVGLCEHTYLTHIINNYDNLSDITIFLTGSCMEIKLEKTMKTIISALITNNSVFYCSKYNKPILEIEGIKNYIKNISVRRYKPNATNDNFILEPSKIRPFYKWYNKIIGKKTDINYIAYEGIFGLLREHIKNNGSGYYKKIIELIDKNVISEGCHYIELSFTNIFYPYPKECVYYFDEALEGKLTI